MARKQRVNKSDFCEIVKKYNKEGNSAAQKYIRENFGVANSNYVIKRIKKSENYTYDTDNDRFISTEENDNDRIFMNLDELCDTRTAKNAEMVINVEGKKDAMESLIKELISDRLLELSRYIIMDTSSRTIMIDVSTMKADGYQVITH